MGLKELKINSFKPYNFKVYLYKNKIKISTLEKN